jgi:hypothetical protein
VQLPGSARRETSEAVVESGTHDTRSLPRVYDEHDEIQDEPSTAANEMILQLARLSNAMSIPLVIRTPRPNEPLDPRAARLLGFIDGRTPLGVIFASAGVGEGEAVEGLAQLVELGVIVVR